VLLALGLQAGEGLRGVLVMVVVVVYMDTKYVDEFSGLGCV